MKMHVAYMLAFQQLVSIPFFYQLLMPVQLVCTGLFSVCSECENHPKKFASRKSSSTRSLRMYSSEHTIRISIVETKIRIIVSRMGYTYWFKVCIKFALSVHIFEFAHSLNGMLSVIFVHTLCKPDY